VSHTAAALVRFGSGADASWTGADLDLTEVDDVDGLFDLLDDLIDQAAVLAAEDPSDVSSVLVLVEEDDEWLGVARVADRDMRVFLSDRRAVLTSEIAERFFSDAAGVELAAEGDLDAIDELEESGTPELSDDPDVPAPMESERPEIEPGGEADLLEDLGVGASQLLKLAAAEGALPADVITTLADSIGAGSALEELRGG
jgi:putative tRNA adenosine deaminase-associated protein